MWYSNTVTNRRRAEAFALDERLESRIRIEIAVVSAQQSADFFQHAFPARDAHVGSNTLRGENIGDLHERSLL